MVSTTFKYNDCSHVPHTNVLYLSTERPIRGYVDPNFPNPNGDWDTPIIIYGYTPRLSVAAFAAAWFLVLLLVHLVFTVRARAWWFITTPIGLVLEIVGYIARSLSAKKDPYNLLFFILNYFFIVTAPVFLAASIYAVLSVLLKRLGRSNLLVISPKVILYFFITCDVVSTAVQVTGAALIGVSESHRKDPTTANHILLAGLACQVVSMGVFVLLVATFFIRARRLVRDAKLSGFGAAFFLATLLIYLRTTFRLAETAQGLYGTLGSHEVYFACLEFAPVAAAMFLLAIWHPARYLGARSVDTVGNVAAIKTEIREKGSY